MQLDYSKVILAYQGNLGHKMWVKVVMIIGRELCLFPIEVLHFSHG
jgi:hypothetical protein